MSPTSHEPESPASTQPSQRLIRTRRVILAVVLAGCIALAWRPLLLQWNLRAARNALSDNNPASALESLQEAQRLAPDNGEVFYLQARAWRRQGELAKVRDALQQASDLGFDKKLLEREQWLAAAQAGQMSLAEPHLEELLLSSGDDGAEVCEAFVNGYFAIYQPERSFPILDAWQADFPEDPRPYFFRGCYLQFLEQTQAAETQFREALGRDPNFAEAQQHLAEVLVRQLKFDEAEAMYQKCLLARPDDARLQADWADCLWQQGKIEESAAVYQRLLEAHPDDRLGRWGTARWLLHERQYQEAEPLLQGLVEDFPWDLDYHYQWAQALQAIGRDDEAREQFAWSAAAQQELGRVNQLQTSLQDEPDSAEIRFQIGRIKYLYDNPAEGVKWLHGVLEIEPQHAGAREILFQHYRQQGLTDVAERFRVSAADPQPASQRPAAGPREALPGPKPTSDSTRSTPDTRDNS